MTQRIKDEIPKSILAQELNVQEIVPSMSGEPKLQETTMTIDEIMSKRLGSYVTDHKCLILAITHLVFGKKCLEQKK